MSPTRRTATRWGFLDSKRDGAFGFYARGLSDSDAVYTT